MRSFMLCLLSLMTTLVAVAQSDNLMKISGTVIDRETKESLPGASVIVKDEHGKIKKYASTKSDGRFELTLPEVKKGSLEVTMMGFAKNILSLDSFTYPLTIYMDPVATLLKEETVKSDRIPGQGDTITYGVSAFAQARDRSIGDVLKRMPGIDVQCTGKIQ